MRIYLVGGAVRDFIMGRGAADKDFLVDSADPEEFLSAFPRARRVGNSLDVYLLDHAEYTLLRGVSVDQDMLARDLTINAMAIGDDGEMVAHPRALEDLKAKLLRPASPTSMSDDPLRILRAARFAALFPDFEPHPSLPDAMRQSAGLLGSVAAERAGRELLKALKAPKPGRFLELLNRTNCLGPWFQELAGADGVPAGPSPYHDEDTLEHTIQVMEKVSDISKRDPLCVWMGMAHDLGKTLTPEDKWPRHFGHDKAGEPLADAMAERLCLSSKYRVAGRYAARYHMTMARYPELKSGTRVDLLIRLDRAGLVENMLRLVMADHGEDYTKMVRPDLEAIKSVSLPEEWRNLGERSGARLRELRCMALKSGTKHKSC